MKQVHSYANVLSPTDTMENSSVFSPTDMLENHCRPPLIQCIGSSEQNLFFYIQHCDYIPDT